MTMVLALILPCISIGRTAAQEKQNSTASESSIESESQARSENSTDDNTGRRIVRVAFPEQAGMNAHLTKPLQIEVVVGTVARLCKTKETVVSD